MEETMGPIDKLRNHEKKVYSRVDQIPSGKASEKLTKGCLVLEGGAFRGLYTQGFLDALMISDINMECVIGVSAGALSGMNYVAGQIGRSGRVNLTYRHDSQYVGAKALAHRHSILDVSFLTEDRGIFEPLDEERFYRKEQRFIAVATDCLTGRPLYLEKGKCSNDVLMKGIEASASMPYITPMVDVGGTPCLDGGCSCKIPYEWALGEGFEKIIVLRTRNIEYRKKEKKSSLAARVYKKYPEFARALENSNQDYNRQCDEIEQLHKEGRLYRAAPSGPVMVGRVEKDVEKLGELYWLGYRECMEKLDELREYLG